MKHTHRLFVLLLSLLLAAACNATDQMPPSGTGGGDGTTGSGDGTTGGDGDTTGGDGDTTGGEDPPPPPPPPPPPEECEREFTLPGYDDASSVVLTGDFTGWAGDVAGGAIALTPSSGGWETSLVFSPGVYQYKFVVDGTEWIIDPTNPDTVDDGFGGRNSVFTCGDGGGEIFACGNPDEFDWRDTVMYFVMTDRFNDSDGRADPVIGATGGDARNGASGQYEGGDLRGVTERLDYLADLGITALWLSAPFENRDTAGAAIDPNADRNFYSGYHGYWPAPENISYADPDNPSPRPRVESRIGTEQDLRDLIVDAHSANTANGQGMKVLFDYVMNHVDLESGLYQSNPSWYARQENGDFALCGPGNYWDDPYWGTRCAFTAYLPPLDLWAKEPRDWSVNDAVWWAKEFDIDGYRLDAIKHVPLEWLTQLRNRLNAALPTPAGERFYMVGETFDYNNRDLLKSFINPDTMLDGQFDFPLKRVLCEAVFDPAGDMTNLSNFMAGNDSFYNVGTDRPSLMTTWIGNHDIPRAIHFAEWNKFGNCFQGSNPGNGWVPNQFPQPQNAAPYEKLAVSFAVLMTNPGIPLIYYGDEVGLAGGGDPDNRRLMPRESDLNEHQKALRAKVRKLARIRGENKIIGRGVREVISVSRDTWVYKMTGCDGALGEIIVAINKAGNPNTVNVPGGTYTDLMTDATVNGGSVQLPGYGFVVLRAQ